MKAILEFDLDDANDIAAHKRCVQALDLVMALYQIDNELRSKLKYADLSDQEYDIYEKIRDRIHEILNSRNIDLIKLII